jgi:hypothetical protein
LLAALHHAGAVFVQLLNTPSGLVIFPASPLQSRSAFSRWPLMSPSARCAKLGVASTERASPAANPAAMYLFPRTILRSPSSF